jgi:ligand-binding sensor domain-containing protein
MGRRIREGILGILLAIMVLAVSAPAMAEMQLFSAGPDQISSVGVLDIVQDASGTLYFATDNGLSSYDGSWTITHRIFGNTATGLLSDYILALEFDQEGSLWIGYPNGLQRLKAGTFVTMRDQQILKSLDIHELMRRDREMWVAAGNSGIHRYLDGTWRWFQPGGPEGQGCGYVTSMTTDPATNTIYVACNEGIWFTDRTGESPTFSPLVNPALVPDPVRGVVGDPFGGIYILNASAILHLTLPDQWRIAVTSRDLLQGIGFKDLRVAADRTLWIATDNGIYAWRDGHVRGHLDAASGIRNNAVKRIFLDASNRLWFVTPENVGYYRIEENPVGTGSPIPFTTFEIPANIPAPESAPVPAAQITPAISIRGYPEAPASQPDLISGFLEAIRRFFAGLFPR